jgi:hypothetical protein
LTSARFYGILNTWAANSRTGSGRPPETAILKKGGGVENE